MDVFRLAIALSGIETKKFDKALLALILNSMYMAYLSNEKFLSISRIQQLIKENYDLEFSTKEIKESISISLDLFLVYEQDKKTNYSLSEKGLNQQKTKTNKYSFSNSVSEFINDNKEELANIGANIDDVESILRNFFYDVFKEGKEEVLFLLKNEQRLNIFNNKRISIIDREIIKLFLNWSNNNKDALVYDIVKSAYDYCILTSKINADESIFSYKKIFLDTNVIFSYVGINGDDRQYSTKLFFKKAKELHSELKYTSVTSVECRDTLKNLIDNMASLFKKENYLSFDEMKTIFPNSNPAALFSLYGEWCSGYPSRNGNYSGFMNEMEKRLETALDELSYEQVEKSFIEQAENKINNLANSLSVFKESLGRKHTFNAALADAKNFYYIDSIKNKNVSTIAKQSVYFSTFDTGLCLWAEKQCEGSTSVFILPSIMYSIMLRFSTRTNDDYRSFNNFLSIRLSDDNMSEQEYALKEEMIEEINNLDLPLDAKKTIAFEANKEIVNQMHDTSPENIVVKDIVNKKADDFYNEFERFKDEEKDKAVEEAEKENYKKGFDDAIKKSANENATKRIKRNKVLRFIIVCLTILLSVSLIAFSIYAFLAEQGDKTSYGWFCMISGLAGAISIPVQLHSYVKNKWFCIDFGTIYEKELIKEQKRIKNK